MLCFDISDADDPLEAGQHSMAARFGQLKVTGACCLLHNIQALTWGHGWTWGMPSTFPAAYVLGVGAPATLLHM